jgi:hypothetical protein
MIDQNIAKLRQVCRRIGARMEPVNSGFVVTSFGRTAEGLRSTLRSATRSAVVRLMIDNARSCDNGLYFS